MHNICYKFIFFSKIRDLPYALQTADRLILKTTFVTCTKWLEDMFGWSQTLGNRIGADELLQWRLDYWEFIL